MKKLVLIYACFLLGLGMALGQEATPRLDKKQRNQKIRIAEGIASGDLSRRETVRLVKQQKNLRKAERRAKSDGVVTKAERASLNRKANRASKNIARQKNDYNSY